MISVKHLVKCYGNFRAVDDLSFEIEKGHIYGFLGPNGAGKTTTMNIMTGCLSQTSGSVTIDGLDIFENAREAKKKIGYLPEIPPLYVDSTPYEYLCFVAKAKGVPKSEVEQKVCDVIEETGLAEMSNRFIKHLSKGYKQRVGIAQALLGSPEVIILDEPTVGLDPGQIIEIRNLIKGLGEKHTVILSSHILSEVQAICEKVLIISHGKLVAFDTPDKLEELFQSKGELYLKAMGDREAAREILAGIEGIENIEINQSEDGTINVLDIRLDIDKEHSGNDLNLIARKVSEELVKAQIAIYQMTPKKASLEDVFMEIIKDDAKLPEQEEQPEQYINQGQNADNNFNSNAYIDITVTDTEKEESEDENDI